MVSFFLQQQDTEREPDWRPATDVYRTRDGWMVKFELAGVEPDDIEWLADVRGQLGCEHLLVTLGEGGRVGSPPDEQPPALDRLRPGRRACLGRTIVRLGRTRR